MLKQTIIPRHEMSSTNYIFIVFIFVATYIRSVTVQQNDTSSLEGLFEKVEFPKSGDLPMLNRKVFRGSRVSITEHPYMVSVRRFTTHYLTGSLLTKNMVITVAHPLHQVSTVELGVVVGENYADRGTSLFAVVILVFHSDFDPYTLAADFVLLRTYQNIAFKISVRPISLASWFTSLDGHTAFVTGWGRCDRMGTELCLPKSSRFFRREKLDPMLRTIKFTLTLSEHCEVYNRHDVKIDKRSICAGPARVDDVMCPCMAVPGAPLVVDAQLAGLQSWGFGCGYTRDMPVVYTHLGEYRSWIVHNIPIMKRIPLRNLTDLFYATKVRQLTSWLYKSRIQLSVLKTRGINQDLQVLNVDHSLVKLKGKVFDVRDFLENGKFHESKVLMYQAIKQTQSRLESVKKIGLKLRTKGKNVPFLSEGMLENTSLMLINGTLAGENELSDESDEEEI